MLGCNKKDNYDPNDCLTPDRQKILLHEMVRYSSKLAPEATHETKFDPEFKWYYDKAFAECQILYCSFEKDSTYYLLVARQARSVTPMQEGIGLHVKFNDSGRLASYEEVFRMWKMPLDTLQKRGKFLFDLMVKKQDLELYYSKFQQDRYIEFPSDRFKFDVTSRKWKDLELDSINLN